MNPEIFLCYILEKKCKLKSEYTYWSSRLLLKIEFFKFTGKQENVQQYSQLSFFFVSLNSHTPGN